MEHRGRGAATGRGRGAAAGYLAKLRHYAWPGNVRELRNVTERLVLQDRSRPLIPDDLPSEIRNSTDAASVDTIRIDRGPDTGMTGDATATTVERLWARMVGGEDFWVVVHQAFKRCELTRAEFASLIDRGLRETHGSYRALLNVSNLSQDDYKRFPAFLYEQECNLPVMPYRVRAAAPPEDAESAFLLVD